MMKQVSPEKLAQAKANLDKRLQADLFTSAVAQAPTNFILYPGAYKIDFESLPNQDVGKDSVAIQEQVKFSGFLLEKTKLAEAIARLSVANFDGKPVTIPQIDKLVFELHKSIGTDTTSQISFGLKGSASVEWLYDAEKLKSDLAGKSKTDIEATLKSYPGISKAEVVIRPFWQSHFPDKISRISVVQAEPGPSK